MQITARHAGLLAASLLALSGPPAGAASGWSEDMGGKLRLLAGSAEGQGAATALWAGIDIVLEPGWKTYWRTPGASGIPPRIDWSASQNVADVEVLWPAPVRFGEGAGESVGYREKVVLPLKVMPADPARPVTLSLKVDYGICETLCVPASAQTSIALDGRGKDMPAIMQAVVRVPRKESLPAPGLSVSAIALQGEGDARRALVEVQHAAADTVDLLAEAGAVFVAQPVPLGGGEGISRFAIDLPEALVEAGGELVLTSTTGHRAVEQRWHIGETVAK